MRHQLTIKQSALISRPEVSGTGHVTAIGFARTHIKAAIDMAPKTAASNRTAVAGRHSPYPGTGWVSQKGDGHRFHPVLCSDLV